MVIHNQNTNTKFKLQGGFRNLFPLLLFTSVCLSIIYFSHNNKYSKSEKIILKRDTLEWIAPDTLLWQQENNITDLRYGRELIANTSVYFGPKGTLAKTTNGMNCQNCHLSAGNKPYGNNYAAVAFSYPKFRARSGTLETVYKRVNDCFERSLNGVAIDTTSKEMLAIAAYILWVGKNTPQPNKLNGIGLSELTYLNRAADPVKGKLLFETKCITCHQKNGEGKKTLDSISYCYPPLWGNNSYNTSAGLYRLSKFAAYVKYNMPQGAIIESQQLTDEEAWDLAAYVNSQPRPKKEFKGDWPDISSKPVDHPFGPYKDSFTEHQHKYGPFAAIAKVRK